MYSLSKEAPLPLYHQIKEVLLQGIRAGQWLPDEQLPTENDLAQRFSVSKITVRQALRELAQLGYVRREQGRGTFVQRGQLEQGPRELTSFTQEMQRHGLSSTSVVLEQGIAGAEEGVAEKLGMAPGDAVFRLRRLRLADGEPMGVQTAHIPAVLVPGIEQVNFEQASLYDTLNLKYGLRPTQARETHSAVLLSQAEAGQLGVAPGSPAMAAERVTYLPGRQPLEYVRSLMRGDRYKIVLELVKEP